VALDPAELEALRASCTKWLAWHGERSPTDLLAELPADIAGDRYGEGGVVAELETRVAELLGKPAAAFFLSGTMAQQIALRVHADRLGRHTVVFHPTVTSTCTRAGVTSVSTA
jgi:dTDP-4-amino-4,6-dideoxygalactose transaminase